MQELVQAILSAPAINVALLCVIATLALLWRRDKKKSDTNGHIPTNGNAFVRRAEDHFKKSHQMANELGTLMLRQDLTAKDVARVESKVDAHTPKIAALEATFAGLTRSVEAMQDIARENHRDISEWMAKILERLK